MIPKLILLALVLQSQLLFGQACEQDTTSSLVSYCIPEEEEVQSAEEYQSCVETVLKCENNMNCVKEVNGDLAVLIEKRITKRGGRVNIDFLEQIKRILAGLFAKTTKLSEGKFAFMIYDSSNTLLYKRTLPKVAPGTYSSPAVALQSLKKTEQQFKAAKPSGKRKIVLGLFRHLSITVSPLYKSAKK